MKQLNPAKSTSFIFTITNRPSVFLRVQGAPIGAINASSAPFSTRRVDLNLPSNKLDFNPMVLPFLVSEHLTEWLEVYKWMIEITKTDDAHLSQTELAELTVLDSENQPILRFIYRGVYPLTLGDLAYSIVDEEVNLICDLTVEFSSMDVEVVSTGELIQYGE